MTAVEKLKKGMVYNPDGEWSEIDSVAFNERCGKYEVQRTPIKNRRVHILSRHWPGTEFATQ